MYIIGSKAQDAILLAPYWIIRPTPRCAVIRLNPPIMLAMTVNKLSEKRRLDHYNKSPLLVLSKDVSQE